MTVPDLFRRPTAFLPPLMSLSALALVLGHVVLFGAAREADEGTAAHLFQLLLAAQLPIIVIFAVTWLPRRPRPAMLVLALQVAGAVAALLPVFLLGL